MCLLISFWFSKFYFFKFISNWQKFVQTEKILKSIRPNDWHKKINFKNSDKAPPLQWKSVIVRGMVFLERDNFVLFYFLNARHLKSGLIKEEAFGGSGLIRGRLLRLTNNIFFNQILKSKISCIRVGKSTFTYVLLYSIREIHVYIKKCLIQPALLCGSSGGVTCFRRWYQRCSFF